MKTQTKVKLCISCVVPALLYGFCISSGRSSAQNVMALAPNPQCSFPALPFPTKLSSDMPYDVDMAKKHELEKQKKFSQVQRMFDIYSWQTFIALNWPAGKDGNPDNNKKLGDPGRRIWETWMEAYQVYKPDGSGPGNPAPPYDWGTKTVPPGAQDRDRVLRMTHKKIPHNLAQADVADETLQAFDGPLVDQNGKWLRYEVLMNQVEYDYVVENRFYNIEGQLAFSKERKTVAFPSGMNATGINPRPVRKPQRGAMELKLAWKELGPGDVKERFLQVNALVQNSRTQKWSRKPMGLVGMHIAVKTESAPTWIWATFEQVDNVRVNPLLAGTRNHEGVLYPSQPSFYDPNQPTKPVNVLLNPATGMVVNNGPYDEDKVTYPVQVTRVIPIPPDKEALNCEVQHLLRGTVFQYYELIDTQWPTGTDPKTGTAPLTPAVPPSTSFPTPSNFSVPNAVANKVPGDITPVFLTNTTMETYFQRGTQDAGPGEEGSPTDNTKVFATESCTGCHYSAGIALRQWTDATGKNQAIYGGAGSGDFSWLMSQKAQWRNPTANGVGK